MPKQKTTQQQKIMDISSLSKSFKGRLVLDGVNLDIKKGEIFGLIGVNGIGKTTLIKMILDLLKIDNGKIEIFSENSVATLARKKIAYLPEKFYPPQLLKGKEFLALSAKYMDIKFDYEEAKILADKLDLKIEALEQNIKSYSKGMGQKLGLISIFLSKKPFLILDEPMSGLDPHVRIRLKDMLREYAAQGNTVFFSSHILSDMEEICHRIAVINNTKVIFDGEPVEFKKKYDGDTLERAFLIAINK